MDSKLELWNWDISPTWGALPIPSGHHLIFWDCMRDFEIFVRSKKTRGRIVLFPVHTYGRTRRINAEVTCALAPRCRHRSSQADCFSRAHDSKQQNGEVVPITSCTGKVTQGTREQASHSRIYKHEVLSQRSAPSTTKLYWFPNKVNWMSWEKWRNDVASSSQLAEKISGMQRDIQITNQTISLSTYL